MRAFLGLAVLFAGLAFVAPRPALAGDGYGYGWGERYRGCSARYRRYVRTRSCTCRHEMRFVARGQSWVLLRRYLDRIRISPRHVHPRRYFFDRWHCALGHDRPVFAGRTCPGEDFPHTECPIAQAALELEAPHPDAAEAARIDAATLDLEDRLALGMERFFRGAYEKAATDFEVVCAERAADARARTGLLLCAIMQSDSDAAVAALRHLHELGEVSGRDRLVLDASFEDPSRFLTVRDALDTATRYHFDRVEPLVVAAWVHAVTGETATARGQLRAALRFAPDHAVANTLLETLDEPRPEPSTPLR